MQDPGQPEDAALQAESDKVRKFPDTAVPAAQALVFRRASDVCND